jgi:hypothetical protein
MSYSVILTKFDKVKSGGYTEKGSQNIESTLLPKVLFDEIGEKYFTLVKIYEEDMEDKYEEKIIQEDKINEFMDLLKTFVIEKMNEIVDDKLSDEEDKALNDVRIFLNLRNLILMKSEKYSDDKSVMLVVG